jgi:hypothetical protein
MDRFRLEMFFVAQNAIVKLLPVKTKVEIVSFYGRITVMEAAASMKDVIIQFLDSTQVCLDQIKVLLASTANPSDDTSLAVRLSMVKVCVDAYRHYSEATLLLFLCKRKFHPRTGHKGPEGGLRYSCTLFFNLGARWGWVVNATPCLLYPRERDPVPIVKEAGWAPGLVWTCVENLGPTGIP